MSGETTMGWQDLVSKALESTSTVMAARYGARTGGTGYIQDASLGAVDQPNDAQARAGSYGAAGGGGLSTGMMIAAGVAVLLIAVVALRK